ncbi:MAG: hypothetical protein ABSA09_12925, partial [Desulfobaccales bacterium]
RRNPCHHSPRTPFVHKNLQRCRKVWPKNLSTDRGCRKKIQFGEKVHNSIREEGWHRFAEKNWPADPGRKQVPPRAWEVC